MIRESLARIPRHDLPKPFSLRMYRPGDDVHWRRIQEASDPYNDITQSLFRKEFGWDEEEIAARQWYLCDGSGLPIGTSTAWYHDAFNHERWGQVHWVAIVPAYQGRGLSKPLLSATLRTMRALGDSRAFLYTSTGRLRAIRLYAQYRFKPYIETSADRKAWDRIEGMV